MAYQESQSSYGPRKIRSTQPSHDSQRRLVQDTNIQNGYNEYVPQPVRYTGYAPQPYQPVENQLRQPNQQHYQQDQFLPQRPPVTNGMYSPYTYGNAPVASPPAVRDSRYDRYGQGGQYQASANVQKPKVETQAKPGKVMKRSKAESLALVRQLKKWLIAASILCFGGLSILAAGHAVSSTSSNSTSTSASSKSSTGTSSTTSSTTSGGFFSNSPSTTSSSSSQGGYGFGSSTSSGGASSGSSAS